MLNERRGDGDWGYGWWIGMADGGEVDEDGGRGEERVLHTLLHPPLLAVNAAEHLFLPQKCVSLLEELEMRDGGGDLEDFKH